MAPSSALHRVAVVIPSRYASSRFPGKPLADLDGEPMIWHVVRQARRAALGDVIVATDDRRILDAVISRGGQAVMTASSCRTGTDRVAEVARQRPEIDHWINLQGDEPGMEPSTIVGVAQELLRGATMATAVAPLDGEKPLWERDVVKAELDRQGRALAFWRTPPDGDVDWRLVRRHLGIYGFGGELLQEFARWPRSDNERAASLEQLRALDRGVEIQAIEVDRAAGGVDRAEDLESLSGGTEGEDHP